jgi:CYTH domain-containing protein
MALVALRHGGMIEKTRFTVPWRGHGWEVDEFVGENAGLVIAEIELRREDETFDRPAWLGIEIPGQAQFYNGPLPRRPFGHWAMAHSLAFQILPSCDGRGRGTRAGVPTTAVMRRNASA